MELQNLSNEIHLAKRAAKESGDLLINNKSEYNLRLNSNSKDIKLNELYKLLNNSGIKFNGVDGKFYFKDNLIERDLEILKIFNGEAKLFN